MKESIGDKWLNIGVHCGNNAENSTNIGAVITSDMFLEEILPYYMEYRLKYCKELNINWLVAENANYIQDLGKQALEYYY